MVGLCSVILCINRIGSTMRYTELWQWSILLPIELMQCTGKLVHYHLYFTHCYNQWAVEVKGYVLESCINLPTEEAVYHTTVLAMHVFLGLMVRPKWQVGPMWSPCWRDSSDGIWVAKRKKEWAVWKAARLIAAHLWEMDNIDFYPDCDLAWLQQQDNIATSVVYLMGAVCA